uniref:SHSP domain-containing protein n=1 Tax=Stomoxys calcitrans TaxID=35570 RepID=A0A1I8PRI2_STOCA
MSLIPFILDLADELHEFSRCLASGIDINDFGFGLYTGSEQQQQAQQPQQQSQQQQSPRRSRTSSFSSFWLPTKRHHPYNRIKSACCGKAGGEEGSVPTSPEKDATQNAVTPGKTASYSVVNKNGFQVSMNVKQFAPSELSVKTIDNCIVVEGRHDDKEDGHGVISRHFVRKYMLPKGYDPKDVLSTLSSDGILTVKAPPPPPPSAKNDEPNERVVEIQPTPGPTQMVVSSAMEGTQPQKEPTKKPSSPAARDECQLPEKRQKLDVPQEQQQYESTDAARQTPTQTPTIPAPSSTEVAAAATATVASTAAVFSIGNENAEKQTAELDDDKAPPQQEKEEENITGIDTDAKEGKITENQLEKKEDMEIDETDKTVVEEEINGSGGDCINNSCESAEAKEPVAENCTTSAQEDDHVPVEAEVSEASESEMKSSNSNATEKMEVDDDDDVADAAAHTADVQDTAAAADDAVNDKQAKSKNEPDDKTINDTQTNNTNSTDNSNNIDLDETENSTVENTADASKLYSANDKSTDDAESANDKEKEVDAETAVLTSEKTKTTTTDINDVALLKAAVTADSADITAAEENALLSESMEGTDTSSAAAESSECALFAKNHLGNGNSAALVAKEEVAN